ncbi:MAG: flagellar hook-associated protein FlgK [Xanthobacteraceae bacterium]
MSLSQAINNSVAGLRVTQAGLALVAGNVANANTPGYVSKTLNQVQIVNGEAGASVRTEGVNRQLDQYIQKQLWAETSGSSYATRISSILGELQSGYGTPGGNGTLETAFSNFTSALQALSTSSGTPTAQSSALSTAQSLALQLNATTQTIQSLRSSAEQDINNSVNAANAALKQIQDLNTQLQGMQSVDPSAAGLQDQRDLAISQLSQLMDIRVISDSGNSISIYTGSGIPLVGTQASQLSFTSQISLNANSLWNADPTKSGVGALTITFPSGAKEDVVAAKGITSGQIGADLNLRDNVLVQAQAQVDQMAATLASALSDSTTNGTAVSSPPQAGFDLDLTNVLPGNTVNITYTDKATNTQHQITIVRVDDPAALPLSNNATTNPNDRVVGINFTGGMASIVSKLSTALGNTNLQFSAQPGSVLRVLDNGSGAQTVNAGSVTTTASVLANGNASLPVFTDGVSLYTGAITSAGSQQTGFAGRITVNPALVTDPTKFNVYNTSPLTLPGDTTRSDYLFTQLTTGSFYVSPGTGLGSTTTPFKSTITNYMQQFLSLQGNASANAKQLKDGQDVVLSTLQQKFDSTSAVNIDTEMSNLIALQNTYAANAHVMAAAQSMMQTLMQIQL